MQNAIVIALFAAAMTANTAHAETFIVEDGQPRATIVVAKEPARMARLAASELQTYVERISGARLPIDTEARADLPVRIYIGRSAHTDRLGLSTADLRHGAYREASGNNWLALVGSDKQFTPVEPYAHSRTNGSGGRAERARIDQAWEKIAGGPYSNPFHYLHPYWREALGVWEYDDAGTLNAVYDFLRAQGVRWYYPGELGEVVPEKADIALPDADATVKPDFAVRGLGFWSKHLGMTPEEHLWTLRMGINHGADTIGLTQRSHGSKFVHLRDELKQTHPEYFALWEGKRALEHKNQGAPCLSSAGFFAHHLNYARAVFDHFNEPMISIDVVDGYGRGLCQCHLCAGSATPERGWEGLMSDYVLGYVNRVAKALYASHPDRMVSALSYGAYALPPEQIDTFPPNLAVWICQSRKNFYQDPTRRRFESLRQQWLDTLPSDRIYIREYYLTARPDGAWKGIPTFFPYRIAEDLRALEDVSHGEYIGVYQPHDRSELGYDYLAINHLNLYITTRLWWNAEQDVNTLLDEYYTRYYGPAHEQMRAFIEYAAEHWPKMRRDVEAIDGALALLDEAKDAAGDTVYAKRVQKIVTYCEPLKRLRTQLSQRRENVPSARALPRAASEFTIDGKLDEQVWDTVRSYQLSEIQTGRTPGHQTIFYVAWGSDDALYLGVRCEDADMSSLNVGTRQNDDPNVWAGDVVELLIETQFHAYYQIAVSPSGAVVDLDRSRGLNTRWDSGIEVATERHADAWTLELRLPSAGENAKEIDPLQGVAGDMPTQTYPWFINVCRQRVRGDQKELTAWSPPGRPRFNVPEKFGRVYAK